MLDNVIFAGLSDDDLEIAARYFSRRAFGAHEVVVAEGDLGDEMFVLTSGRATVKVGGQRVADVPAQEVFGEVCLLEPGTRTASVIALNEIVAWSVDTATFNRLCGEHPAIALRITLNLLRLLGERLRKADALIRLEREERSESGDDEADEGILQRILGVITIGKSEEK